MIKLTQPHVFTWEDGSVVMEWAKKDRRFYIAIENDLSESSWGFVGKDNEEFDESFDLFSDKMIKFMNKFFEE